MKRLFAAMLVGTAMLATPAAAQEEQFQARVERLREDLDKLLTILPERRDVDKIMDQVQALARQEDLSISRFQPRGEIEREYFNEWPINISLSGTSAITTA